LKTLSEVDLQQINQPFQFSPSKKLMYCQSVAQEHQNDLYVLQHRHNDLIRFSSQAASFHLQASPLLSD